MLGVDAALAQDSGRGSSSMRFAAFDTVVELTAYGAPDVSGKALRAAQRDCEKYEQLFSRTIRTSDIGRINDAAGASVRIDARTFDLLKVAQRYCAASRGVFDITVGSLVRCWDFRRGVVPKEEDLIEAVRHVDWRMLRLERRSVVTDEGAGSFEGGCYAQLADPLGQVDVGGIAKGWIADRLCERLAQAGCDGYVVNLGGNVAVGGRKPDGSDWRIGVRDPQDPARIIGCVALDRGSAVTSGIYERGFVRAGHVYHHILDPRTGHPVETDVASVTVVARASLDAEGFSTTLLAMGAERGLAFAKERPEILQTVFIDKAGRIDGFARPRS